MHRRLARAAGISVVLIGLALLALDTGETVSTAQAKVDPGLGVVEKIRRYQRMTWRWQRLMGVRRTPTRSRYLQVRNPDYRVIVMHQWRRRAIRAKRRAHNPPHEGAWRCLQRYEAAWNDAHDPYWGGLQMDRSFMRRYAPRHLLRRGWANRWTPIEQMWVGERALRAGRGFYPWPHTGRICGLI